MAVFPVNDFEWRPAIEEFCAERTSAVLTKSSFNIGTDAGVIGVIARLDDVDRPVNPAPPRMTVSRFDSMLYKYTGFLQGTFRMAVASLLKIQSHSCTTIGQTASDFEPFYSLTCYFMGWWPDVDRV